MSRILDDKLSLKENNYDGIQCEDLPKEGQKSSDTTATSNSSNSASAQVKNKLDPISNIVIPMDGYHYPLSVLQTSIVDADSAVYRRGAPDTFDAKGLRMALHRIKSYSSTTHDGDDDFTDTAPVQVVPVPGFDHAKGDPQPDEHIFQRKIHRVVICEGLYLLHDKDGWEGTSNYFDLSVFISADIERCMDRVMKRNKCIPGYTAEEIIKRTDAVDRVNAYTVNRTKIFADIVVHSVL